MILFHYVLGCSVSAPLEQHWCIKRIQWRVENDIFPQNHFYDDKADRSQRRIHSINGTRTGNNHFPGNGPWSKPAPFTTLNFKCIINLNRKPQTVNHQNRRKFSWPLYWWRFLRRKINSTIHKRQKINKRKPKINKWDFIKTKNSFQKTLLKNEKGWGCSAVVQHLPSIQKALSSISHPTRRNEMMSHILREILPNYTSDRKYYSEYKKYFPDSEIRKQAPHHQPCKEPKRHFIEELIRTSNIFRWLRSSGPLWKSATLLLRGM